MKAIINGKEYELATFEILVRGDDGHEKAIAIRGEIHGANNGECQYVKTDWRLANPPRPEIRHYVKFEDACIVA